jgi:hypothetical protein
MRDHLLLLGGYWIGAVAASPVGGLIFWFRERLFSVEPDVVGTLLGAAAVIAGGFVVGFNTVWYGRAMADHPTCADFDDRLLSPDPSQSVR